MKKTIQLNGVDPIIFAGVNDQNIKIIDTNFESSSQQTLSQRKIHL